MVLATISLVILSTCPNQLSRFYFMYLTIFSLLVASSNFSFVLSLHSPFAFCVGPNILLNIFLSNTNNFCLMFSVKTQHSDPYTTNETLSVASKLTYTRSGQKVSLQSATFVSKEPCTIPNAAQNLSDLVRRDCRLFSATRPDLGGEKSDDNRETVNKCGVMESNATNRLVSAGNRWTHPTIW